MFPIKFYRFLLCFGIFSALAFFAHTLLGKILQPAHNPITQYISEYTAEGAPFASLLRALVIASIVFLLIFVLCMIVRAFQYYGTALRVGYCLLFVTALVTGIYFGLFPMTLDRIIHPSNFFHYFFTITVLCCTILSLILLAIGYQKLDVHPLLKRLSVIEAILFIFFNLAHLAAILLSLPVQGLLERCSVYSLYLFILVLSWYYAARRKKRTYVFSNR